VTAKFVAEISYNWKEETRNAALKYFTLPC